MHSLIYCSEFLCIFELSASVVSELNCQMDGCMANVESKLIKLIVILFFFPLSPLSLSFNKLHLFSFLLLFLFHVLLISFFHDTSSVTSSGVVRTLKAENRQQGRLPSQDGGAPLSRFDEDEFGSSVDPRELEAQKRAAWRKARCVMSSIPWCTCVNQGMG